MAAVHADAAVFGFTAYSQGIETPLQVMEARDDLKNNFHPGERCPCSKEDFIVFAEFSEVTGPIPLLTIPSKLECYEEIDINALIMKIMSVDYQANPSGQFAFCQDVQVLQSEVLPGRHAYVHYCTLHDLRARGFVRPLCLAYISADHMKLQSQFDNLRKKFLSAIEILKYNNRQTFIDEISQVLANLKEIQNKYFFWKKKEEDGEVLTAEERRAVARTHLDQLAHQQSELYHMLLAAEPLQDNLPIENQLLHWQGALEFSCEDECRLYVSRTRVVSAVASASAASLGPPASREPLRSVPALAPWGMALMLWQLLSIQRFLGRCRLHSTLLMFSSDSQSKENSAVVDLADSELLQLLLSVSVPFHWPVGERVPALSSPIDGFGPDSLEYVEANLVASGNEASSSYHSAPESLSEIFVAAHPEGDVPCGRRSSLESFLDVPTDSDSEEPLPEEDEGEIPETWTSCAWSDDVPLGPNVAGRRLLRFFQRYPQVSQHIVHSLLTGRTVVLAAGEVLRARVRTLLVALSALVPVSPPCLLWWHRGILVSSHVSAHQLIGVCVPERLSVHDMISPRDKNLVTILEVASGRLWGPAYSGQLLSLLESVPASLPSDHTLLLLLRSVADGIREKLFLLRTVSSSSSVSESLARLGLTGCDADILRHLFRVGLST